jgi:trimeric autotransporter adhesin
MATVKAVSAAALGASIGVNVHLSDNAGPYGNLGMVENELKFLGINQIRDNEPYDWSVPFYQAIAATGVKLDLIIGYNPGETMNTADLKADLALIDKIAAATPGSIIGLEGLNEPYNFPNTWNGQATDNWTTVAQVQAAEYALVKGDPNLKSVPVLSTSTDLDSFPGSTPVSLASVADFGNAHVYPYGGGQPPFVMNAIVSGQHTIVPNKPAWITEFGYSTAYKDTDYGVDQSVQAKNSLNGLLEAFKGGVTKTFLYQLNDEIANPSASDIQNNWGLFNADGTPKLAATAIHNLTSILADTGANALTFTPGQIGYTINNLPSTGQSLLLEKSSGTFDLAIWNDAVDWNPSSHTDVAVAAVTTTVSLATTYANINVFDPMGGTAPIATYHNVSSVPVPLTDHPVIIELSGTASGAPPVTKPAPSPNGTKVTSASAAPIIDQAGNAWKLVQSATQGLQIAVNGTVDAVTSNVTLLELLNGAIVQKNSSNYWYSEPGPNGPWTQISALTPSISVTRNATGGVSTIDGTKAGTLRYAGATIVLTAPGVAKVTIGATADTLKFIGMSSVSVTAGTAASMIVADGGKNSFTGAAAAIDITGGAGADAYLYHKGNGLMTIEDFSPAKGDTITIDKSLQATMKQSSDGHGGTLLSFGAAGQGIDLRNVTDLLSAQLHFA